MVDQISTGIGRDALAGPVPGKAGYPSLVTFEDLVGLCRFCACVQMSP